MIAKIYRLETTFKKRQAEIDECLNFSRNEDRFYEFINNAIRDQVEVLHGLDRCLQEESINAPRLFVPWRGRRELAPQDLRPNYLARSKQYPRPVLK